MADLQPDTERQAVASFRGYAYQALQTIRAWLNCGQNEEIRCEFAEDIDLLRRDLKGQVSDVELTQVKHEQRNVTLRSKAASDLINNFFRHKQRNKSLKLKMRLCAISDRGVEASCNWPGTECGMDLWDKLKARSFSNGEEQIAIEKLRSFLQDHPRVSEEAKSFLSSFDNSTFLSEFVDCISWDTGQAEFHDIQAEICRILATRERPITDPHELQQVLDRLWRSVMDLLAQDPERLLTYNDLEELLAQETTARVDRRIINEIRTDIAEVRAQQELSGQLIQHIASQVPQSGDAVDLLPRTSALSENLPPLPSICCDRTRLLQEIGAHFNSKLLIWIYGSTGFGKTTIANLYVRNSRKHFLWFRLRGLADFQLLSALHMIIDRLKSLSTGNVIVVLDDLTINESDTYSLELIRLVVDMLRRKESQLLITSQRTLPTRLESLLNHESFSIDLPELSCEEIGILLRAAGLVEDKLCNSWASYISAMTGGHPQLAGAYVAYARGISWKLSADELLAKPRSAEKVREESRRLLTETIHLGEARELARRLSIIKGAFTREFAIKMARCQPSIEEPGRAFEELVGPWIEGLDGGYYSLSPLLEGYAEAELGQTGVIKFYRMSAYAWFAQRALTPLQFMQLITAALLSNEEPPLAKAVHTLLFLERDKLNIMAKELSFLPFVGLGTAPALSKLNPTLRYLFRQAQLKIAAHNGQWTTYAQLDGAILQELQPHLGTPPFDDLLLVHYVDTCIRKDSPISSRERIRRAIQSLRMANEPESQGELAAWVTTNTSFNSIVLLATSSLEAKEDLDYLLNELGELPKALVEQVFSAFVGYEDLLSLLVDRVWFEESKRSQPEWEECLAVFDRVMSFAREHENQWFLVSAARAKMVIKDEYLHDSASALEIAATTREMLPNSHPLLDLAESTVRFRSEEHSLSLELFDRFEESLSMKGLALADVFALRRAILSSSRLKLWDKVRTYAHRGREISESIDDSVLAELIGIAFQAELGWVAYEERDTRGALREFEAVLRTMERFVKQDYPLFHIFHLRFGHLMGWLGSGPKGSFEPSAEKQADRSRPFGGMFANLEDPPEGSLERQKVLYQGLWAMLAKYGAWYISKEHLEQMTERALVRSQESEQYLLAVWVGSQASFANNLALKDFDSALWSGLGYTRDELIASTLIKEGAGALALASHSVDFDKEFEKRLPSILVKWAERIPESVLEPILMAVFATEEPQHPDFTSWRQRLTQTFGERENISLGIDCFQMGFEAACGSREAIAKAKEMALNPSETNPTAHRLAHVICCGSRALSINDGLSAQSGFLINIHSALHDTVYAQVFTRMVARRWIFLAENQKFLLGNPRLDAPSIVQAASSEVPTVAECAGLLLTVGRVTHARWPQDMLETLRSLSQTGS